MAGPLIESPSHTKRTDSLPRETFRPHVAHPDAKGIDSATHRAFVGGEVECSPGLDVLSSKPYRPAPTGRGAVLEFR